MAIHRHAGTLCPVNSVFDSSPRATLRSLVWLRWCLLAAATAAVGLGSVGLIGQVGQFGETLTHSVGLALSLWPILLAGAGWNGYAHWRMQRPAEVSQWEVSVHLLVDALLLTGLLAGSGGAANPFVALYLLPVAFAAVTLRPLLAWGLLAGCGALYSLLIWRLLSAHAHHDNNFVSHMLGMWANYWIAAGLIVVFVGALARRLRDRDAALANARAAQIRNEQVVALGAVAAATVHELGGPLSSIDLLAESLQQREQLSGDGADDLRLLREQLALCRSQLDELLRDTGQTPGGNWQEFLRHAVDRFRALRPEITVDLALEDSLLAADADFQRPQGLMLWLWGLLNNAADASLENGASRITLRAAIRDGECRIEVQDAGRGLVTTPGLERHSSKSSKGSDDSTRGWGLLLGHAGIESIGGRLEFVSGDLPGTCAIVTLPVTSE